MTPALLLLAALPGAAPQPATGLTLPQGFAAYAYSDPALANDIYTMTVDPTGRVIVAGRGYIRALVDDDGDGQADRAIDLLDNLPDGPMGLLADGDSLYVVAGGGLKRYRGYTGTEKLTTPSETLLAVKTTGEHDAHAVRRGPDGWLYLMCGNMAGVKKEQISPQRSPVKDVVGGCLLRISPDGRTVEAVADGFRNAYGFDFNADGEAFTYDSDNERCVGLPWYEPCRFYHVVPGGNYGWRSPQLSQTWRKPPYYADVVPPVCTTGRGSPTGVACYRNSHFPERYRNGFFIADWTWGRVYFVPLEAKGSTYAGKPEVFLEATGEMGFAPTALAVHPQTGELLVSIGGRGTRGGVYRIRCEKGGGKAKPLPMAERSLGWSAEAAKGWLADAGGDSAVKRRQALELMLRWREKLGYGPKLFELIHPNLKHTDPLIRAAAGRLTVATGMPTAEVTDPLSKLTLALALVPEAPLDARATAVAILSDRRADVAHKLIAVRVLQLALGDLTAPNAVGTVWEGYTLGKPVPGQLAAELKSVLRAGLDSSDRDLERELTRTLAALGGENRLVMVLALELGTKSKVRADFHLLAVLAQCEGPWSRSDTRRVAEALRSLDRKADAEKLTRDRFWPLRVEEIVRELAGREPSLADTVAAHKDFGRPEHVHFVAPLGLDKVAAARRFLAYAEQESNYAWTPGVVALLAVLPAEETRPILRKLWERGGLEDAIVPILAQSPQAEDGPKFVTGLHSLDPNVVKAAAVALAVLPARDDKADVIAAIGALRRLPDDKSTAVTREQVTTLLRKRTGQTFGPDAKPWTEWFVKAHPDLAAKVTAADGFDPAAWAKREAAIPWADGDPVKGRAVFAKATCAACHDGGGAVGPSLVGVAKRFGRADLLTAILQPSKDVSPRYRATRINTTDGKAHVGMVVYDAPDGMILQTGPDTAVRVVGNAIETRRVLDTSPMPAGLLDKLPDRDVADLLAYLRTLDDPNPK